MQKLPLLIVTALLLLVGCRKGEIINKVVVEEDDPQILVVSSFKGKVVNEFGEAVGGANVRVYHSSTTTDANGVFVFNNVESPKASALISVEKNGYFIGSAMAGNSAGGKNYVNITLLNKGTGQQVNAAAGGTLSWPDGSKVTIKPNTLQTEDGSPYSGNAQVYARWLDPTRTDLGAVMPGALRAKDADGNEKVLATYGMMGLELETVQGEKLKIKEGETADLDLPVPPSLDPTAPTDIPLWYFDLEEERWLLKGSCQHSSGGYHCSVPSGGYWNCDVMLEPICLSGTIYQSDSVPAFYTKVIVKDLTDNFIYYGYTDINGFFCGSVPKGAMLEVTIVDLCGNILYQVTLPPHSQDYYMGDIYLPNTLQQYFIHVGGQLMDCAGAPATLGQVAVQYPGRIRLFPVDPTGFINFDLALNCIEYPDLMITAYDLSGFKATPVQVHTGETTIDLGTISACNDPEDFFILTAGSNTYSASPTRFYKKNNVTTNWMVLEGLTVGGSFVIDLRQYNGVGQYDVNVFLNTKDAPDAPAYPVLNTSSPDIPLNITADDGNFISGNFTGTAYDVFGQPQPISGSFKVKKPL